MAGFFVPGTEQWPARRPAAGRPGADPPRRRGRHPRHLVPACGGQHRAQLQVGQGGARSSPAARPAWLPAPPLCSSSTSCRTPWADPPRRRGRHPRHLVRAIGDAACGGQHRAQLQAGQGGTITTGSAAGLTAGAAAGQPVDQLQHALGECTQPAVFRCYSGKCCAACTTATISTAVAVTR